MGGAMTRFLIALLIGTASVVLVNPGPSRGEDPNVVRWGTIIGLAAPGSAVGGFQPFGVPPGSLFPWNARDGKVWVHLQTGRVKFSVKGLVLANSTALAVAGTTGVPTEVKGTLVCNGLATGVSAYADTPAVPFDSDGTAEFVGAIDIPLSASRMHLKPHWQWGNGLRLPGYGLHRKWMR
jgi:hypothetical protein